MNRLEELIKRRGLEHLKDKPEQLNAALNKYSQELKAKSIQGEQEYQRKQQSQTSPPATTKIMSKTPKLDKLPKHLQEKVIELLAMKMTLEQIKKAKASNSQAKPTEKRTKQQEQPKDSDSRGMSLIEWLRTMPPGGKLTVKLPGEK